MPSTIDLLRAADAFLAGSWELTEEDYAARLDAFLAESEDKLGALRAVHVQLEARAATCKAEADRFTAARKSAEKQDERVYHLAGALLAKMRELGEEPNVRGVARLQRNGGKVPLVKDQSVFDEGWEDRLPDDLVIVKRTANFDAIRAALEAGRTVPGVTLGERGEGVRFS